MASHPQLSRYDVLGRLATGGMADVWLARARGVAGFEKLVVLKTILPELVANRTFVSMFINEGRLAAMLSHPNCVQIFELGQENDTLFLAMEYVEGFSLSRLLQRTRDQGLVFPERLLARVLMDAASGLDYAHRLTDREGNHLGLVHRDVSPDNLLVSFSGQTKLVDFGIAKAATPALLHAGTVPGTIKGKHGYIAPEYLLGEPIDGRADVFALGVVMYRALTGTRPFAGKSETAISLSVINDVPRLPHELKPTVSPALSAVVMKALEKSPDARFDSARALRQALELAVGRAGDAEDVADFVQVLWPPGDAERVALQSLASGTDESSQPALRSVVSGAYGVVGTPAPAPLAAGVQVDPSVEALLRPPEQPQPPAVFAPTLPFDAAPASRKPVWLVLGVVLLGLALAAWARA